MLIFRYYCRCFTRHLANVAIELPASICMQAATLYLRHVWKLHAREISLWRRCVYVKAYMPIFIIADRKFSWAVDLLFAECKSKSLTTSWNGDMTALYARQPIRYMAFSSIYHSISSRVWMFYEIMHAHVDSIADADAAIAIRSSTADHTISLIWNSQ